MSRARPEDRFGSRATDGCQRASEQLEAAAAGDVSRSTDADAGGRAHARVGVTQTLERRASRILALDAFRGVAVVLMVAWHATDGWLADAHRTGIGWSAARVVGGLAAPFFFFAAGVGLALGARRGRGLSRAVARGLELVVLGHALRLATWAIDRMAIADARAWPALVLGTCFVVAALAALRAPSRRRVFAVFAVAFLAGHVAAVLARGPALARLLMRFDVLHCIGASTLVCALAAYALVRAAGDRSRLGAWLPPAMLGLGALAIVASSVPLARELDPAGGVLAWIARGRELRSLAPFPLAPWCGYAMLGCAIALSPSRAQLPSRGLGLTVVAIGLALFVALVAFEGGPLWTRTPLGHVPTARALGRLVFHAASATAILLSLAALAERGGSRTRAAVDVLAALGIASLPIYALHLQVAYGKLSAPVDRALDPRACAALVVLLITITTGATLLATRKRRGGERAHTLSPSSRSIASSQM